MEDNNWRRCFVITHNNEIKEAICYDDKRFFSGKRYEAIDGSFRWDFKEDYSTNEEAFEKNRKRLGMEYQQKR